MAKLPWNEDASSFPTCIQEPLEAWLLGEAPSIGSYDYNVVEYLEDALSAGSPYALAHSFDPTDTLLDLKGELSNFTGAVDSLPTADALWRFHLENAKGAADAWMCDDENIAREVAAYRVERDRDLQSAINRFSSGMYGSNAVNTSAFVIGLAKIYGDYNHDIAAYEAKLRLQRDGQRTAFVSQSMGDQRTLTFGLLDAKKTAVGVKAEISRLEILSMKEYLDEALQIAVSDAEWDLNLFKHGASMLGAAGGMPLLPQRQTRIASALSSALPAALTGLMIGGALGTAGGPEGMLIGGLLGATLFGGVAAVGGALAPPRI